MVGWSLGGTCIVELSLSGADDSWVQSEALYCRESSSFKGSCVSSSVARTWDGVEGKGSQRA